MKTRNSALYALGLAAAMTIGGAATASAQVTRAQPQTRIPVRKEVPVQPPRVDTVTVTRVDTVTVRTTDTVSTTVMRYDTVTRMVYPPLQRLPGLYFGVGLGANIPMNDIRGYVKDSWAGQVQAGYFPGTSPFGIRADATYGMLSARDKDCASCSDPKVWTVGGDIILRWPLDRQSKLNPVLYAFGGGGWASFSDVDARQIVPTGDGPLDLSDGHGYWDVGPGVDFNLGGAHLYAEGRYMTIMTENKNAHMFPVYAGFKFY